MDYKNLTREDFDAVVTGELTHYAIWLESVIIDIITDFFVLKERRAEFERLLLRRDGLTFQDKLEITRGMLPLFTNREGADRLKNLLGKIEDFKSKRNSFAHGLDVTPCEIASPTVHIEIITRSGKGKVVVVTPESHIEMLDHAEDLLKEAQSIRNLLRL